MKRTLIAVAGLFAVFVTLQACSRNCAEPKPVAVAAGMKVVAAWQGNNWWVAKVDAINGDQISVTYSDNTKGQQPTAKVIVHPEVLYINGKPCCFKAGDKVVAKWRNDSWWVATIDKVDGANANVTYSDGEKGVQRLLDMVRYQ